MRMLKSVKSAENKERFRPVFHFTAKSGWINDPVGLIFFQNRYHLFYQFNPYGCDWGSMHWGHAVSDDLVHWKDLPIALSPDSVYDHDKDGGCFSGSAIEKDGKLYLFYTGTVFRDGIKYQTQCMAESEDGVTFKKSPVNPVIANPPDGCGRDFRDPKVFRHGNHWYMVVGGATGIPEQGGEGRIYLYQSDDLFNWEYRGILLKSSGRWGTMFECPDLYEIDGKWVITSSPILHEDYNKCMYLVGVADLENCDFEVLREGSLDLGYDYYAAQSFTDRTGRRIMIAWQNGWKWMPWFQTFGPTQDEGWRGQLSIPRIVSVNDDNSLKTSPVETLSILRYNVRDYKDYKINIEKQVLDITDPNCFMIEMEINVDQINSKAFTVGVWDTGSYCTVINFDFLNRALTVNLENSDAYSKSYITAPISFHDRKIKARIIGDRCSVEIYLNDGDVCITNNIYPESGPSKIWIKTPYSDAKINNLSVCSLRL